mgnify:FL=1
MYEPPFDPTDKITATALDIAEMVGRLAPDSALSSSPVLHRELRIKTIHSSLAIEQNTLTMEQVTDIIDGRRVFGPPDDIREVRNAKRAYDLLGNWDPRNMDDLLEAHGVMMEGLRKDAGTFRTKNAGVYDGDRLIHAGTPASYVPEVMAGWVRRSSTRFSLRAYSITSSNSSTRSPTETAASEGSGTRCCWLDGAPCSPGCRSKA